MEGPKALHLQQKRVRLDPDIFDASALADEMNLDIAVGIVESHLANAVVDTIHILSQLLAQKGLFEYIVSVLSPSSYASLEAASLATFCTAAKEFGRCFAHTLLQHLATYFSAHLPSADACRHAEAVDSAPQALGLLAPLCDDLAEAIEVGNNEQQGKGKAKCLSRSVAKQQKRAAEMPSLNKSVFAQLNVDRPTSRDQVPRAVKEILAAQKEILKDYLQALRNPVYAESIRDTCIPKSTTASAVYGQNSNEVEARGLPSSDATEALRGALCLPSADGFGAWRVFLPQRAQKDLKVFGKRNPPLYEIVMKKLRELSHGLFSADNQKRLDGPSNNSVPIYEAKMTGDTRLVYQIHCVQEIESEVETQVIWVYGIYTHAQLHGPRFWSAMSQKISGAGAEYRHRCKPQRYRGGAAVLPLSWPPKKVHLQNEEIDLPDLSIKDKRELQALLVSEKFAAFTQDLLFSITHDEDVAPLFQLSPEEQTIVLHAGSCFVIGRSGTGKTMTMVIKMVGIERMWSIRRHAGAIPRPRQIFVTQSAMLADKVKEYYERMTAFFEARDMVRDNRAYAVTDGPDGYRVSGLYDRDEEEEYREDLPKKFSELTDEHFPLFLTYHRVCRLLEEDFMDIDEDIRRRDRATSDHDDQPTNEYMLQSRPSFISYATFLESYWAHFPEYLTKRLDPFLVFSQFMGVIKGSKQALKSNDGYLDRATYMEAGCDSSVPISCKGTIYNLFELYTKRKALKSEYDAADRTRALVQRLRQSETVLGTKADYTYVDEVQDNLLADAEILRTICRRPEGMFWAGDTAQTISAGSSFKFNELKDTIFQLEGQTNTHNPGYFHLNRNFRSHSGIVQAAQTIISIIVKFWRNSIDVLEEEKGLIEGPKPLFIGGTDDSRMPHFIQFMRSANRDVPIEFGAQQCILVRNDAARDELRRKFGSVGVILTPYESKGQEFEDVLLYNFFSDSTISASQWRVLLNCLPPGRQAVPVFDDVKHHGLCFELKCLYVAVTRARSNLWIVDYSTNGETMQLLWSQRNQIEVWTPGTEVPRLAQDSSHEQWADTAEALFHKKNYKEAVLAYSRAGEKYALHRAISEAHSLRETARRKAASSHADDPSSVTTFIQAAEAFRCVAHGSTADRKIYLRQAADCYIRADDHDNAAECYENADLYTVAAQHYRLAGRFDDAVRVVQTFTVDPVIAQKLIHVAAFFYLRNGQINKARSVLGSVGRDVHEYVDTYGPDSAKAALLEESGRDAELVRFHLDNSNLSQAVSVCSKNGVSLQIQEQVAAHIMAEFWKFATLVNCAFDIRNKRFASLHSLVSRLCLDLLPLGQRMELLVLPTLASNNTDQLLRLGFDLLGCGREAEALLCLDQAYMHDSWEIRCTPVLAVQERLDQLFRYANVLEGLIYDPNIAVNPVLHQLFAIQPSATQYRVRNDSPLCLVPDIQALLRRQGASKYAIVDRRTLASSLRGLLEFHLSSRVRPAIDACKKCKALTVCLQFTLEGRCKVGGDCDRTHTTTTFDEHAYNARVSLHATIIRIYHTLRGIEAWSTRQEQQRYWLIRLKDVLHPPISMFGSLVNSGESLPADAVKVISAWLSDSLFKTNRDPSYFLNDLFRFAFMSNSMVADYIPAGAFRAPCLSDIGPDWLLRGEDQVDIVQDFLRFVAKADTALSSAILMTRHIIEGKLRIDVGLLCDLLDTLCGTLVIARRIKQGGNFHGLTFPASWFQRLGNLFDGLCPNDIKLGWMYLEFVKTLLGYLQSQADHLRLGSGQTGPLFALRNAYIARICYNISYLGYNLRDEQLRSSIVQVVTSLKPAPGRQVERFPRIYQRFATARRWSDLVHAIRENSLGGTADPLVELLNAARTAPLPSYTHRVVYRESTEIPRLLETYLASSFTTSRCNNPRNGKAEDITHHDHRLEVDPEDAITSMTDEQHEKLVFKNVQEAKVYSEKDFEAVKNALNVCRSARTTPLKRNKISGRFSDLFARECKAFLVAAANEGWNGSGISRRVFFWAYPHLAVATKGIINYLRAKKTGVKKQLADQTTSHLELDNLMHEMTTLVTLLKVVEPLSRAVEPRRDIFGMKYRCIEARTKLANDIENFMSRQDLPVDLANEWGSIVQTGLKGIRLHKGPLVKQKKPLLVIDDEELIWGA